MNPSCYLTLIYSYLVTELSKDIAAFHLLPYSTTHAFSLARHSKPSTSTLITLSIYSLYTTGTSQVTHLQFLDSRPLTFIPHPSLTCLCRCWNYYDISKSFCISMLTVLPLSYSQYQMTFPSCNILSCFQSGWWILKPAPRYEVKNTDTPCHM